MYDIEKLLTDMRVQVSYSDKAEMPIPLYERMKEAVQELQQAREKLKKVENLANNIIRKFS